MTKMEKLIPSLLFVGFQFRKNTRKPNISYPETIPLQEQLAQGTLC